MGTHVETFINGSYHLTVGRKADTGRVRFIIGRSPEGEITSGLDFQMIEMSAEQFEEFKTGMATL